MSPEESLNSDAKREPVRVLAVVHNMIPAGLEMRLMDVLRAIDSTRVRIDVFTWSMEEGIYDEEIRSLGGTVYYNPPLSVKNMFRYPFYFRDFLKEHPEYRIVHAHQDAWCSVFCKGAYLAGVPVRIAHSRTAIRGWSMEYMIKNLIKLPTRKYATHYFAVSEVAGRWLFGDRAWEQGKVTVWPNAIDAEQFRYNPEVRKRVREDFGWEDSFIVMHVGNFMPPKNHPFLLRVFQSVAAEDPDAKLVLIGDGDKKESEQFVAASGLKERVEFLGRRKNVNELLQGADVFLFPSLFEGLPGAMVEAQAAGLSCIMSDTITKEVVLTPQTTCLPLSDGPEKWAKEVLAMKDIQRSDQMNLIKDAGFDIHSLVGRYEKFYESTDYHSDLGNRRGRANRSEYCGDTE